MKTPTNKHQQRRHSRERWTSPGARPAATIVVAPLICCLLFLSISFFGSQANAATTASNNQQLQPQLELPPPSSSSALAQAAAAASTSGFSGSRQSYFGTLIGRLSSAGGQVSGDVYAVDEQTLFIKGFNYDGQAPDAYFWSSTSAPRPSNQDGFIVPDEKGSTKPLERYTNKDVVLRLPEGKTLREIPWLSIWSRQLKLSVGDIMIPRRELIIPRPLEIAPLTQLAHGLKSGPITIVDAQTLLVSDFHYDGLGPDAYFWLTRGGSGLAATNSLKLKDENGLSGPLRKYQGETIVVSLPDEFTIYDFDYFGVWCKQFSMNFGQTQLPGGGGQLAARVPPSPKMLGIKPENKLNCEILYDDLGFEIRWVLDGDDIVMQLVGKIDPGEYMAFGLGKDDSKSDMNNADAVVAWVDRHTGQVHATDYFLGSKQQCINDPKEGSCPDVKLANGSDSLTLLHGAIVNGYSMVTFKRPQLGVDELYDQHVYSDGQQSVIWAIGTLNKRQEIGYHRLRTRSNMFIDFARNPQWNCPIPDLNASMHNNLPITSASQVDQTVVSSSSGGSAAASATAPETAETSAETLSGASSSQTQPIRGAGSGAGGGSIAMTNNRQQTESSPTPLSPPSSSSSPAAAPSTSGGQRDQAVWFIPQVVCPNDRTFHAQIGPTAGKKGYAAQTGRTSWIPPVSWYINGLLAPELVVERGQTYYFVVEGGNDKTSSSRRHPFYLTDSPEGGFNFKTDAERMRERIFGGVAMRASDGQFVPTAEGRLCEWKTTNATLANPDLYQTFSSYQRTLKLDCLAGRVARLQFTPDSSTPDLIYYQCYTNRFMGWRIRVVDSCGAYISSQLNQLKQQQLLASVSASSGNRSARSELLAPADGRRSRSRSPQQQQQQTSRVKDTLSRRESSFGPTDLMDLKPQASEERMLSFEPPPPGLDLGNQQQIQQRQQQQRQQQTLLNDAQEFNFMQTAGAPGAEFGDEFAASEEFHHQNMANAAAGGGSGGIGATDGMLLMNNSFLSPSYPGNRFNLSTIEQILKLSPSDLEFLDDTQLDLVSAVALASASNPSQFLQNIQQPLPLKSLATPNQNSTNSTTTGNAAAGGSKSFGARMPKSLHNYMRRLASIYQPVQQQLASMLSLPGSTQTTSTPTQTPTSQQQQQQQQQLMANLHQQIIAAAALVPSQTANQQQSNNSNNNNSNNIKQQQAIGQTGEPSASASSQSSSFSLANLVPKSKIDLSKSNLGKRFNKLRIKTGRKYEPQQQQQQATTTSSSTSSQTPGPKQAQPPTPDNEFNYDIFNNHLLQLEERQKQFQSIENFAAALAAASNNNNNMNWQIPAPLSMPQQQQQQHYQMGYQPFLPPSGSSEANDNLVFSSAYEPAPPLSPLRHQQHFVEPLQQQQSSLNILENILDRPREHRPREQQQQQQQQQQQAVFITKLPQQTTGMLQQQQQQPFVKPTDNRWQHQDQVGNRYPQVTQQQQQIPAPVRQVPSYLDSTDYNSIRQNSPVSSQKQQPQVEKQQHTTATLSTSENNELLNGSDGTNHYLIRQQEPNPDQSPGGSSVNSNNNAAAGGELDHMMAIERYSKQSSERRPPSIVLPVTGEQVVFPTGTGPDESGSPNRTKYQHHYQPQQQSQQQPHAVRFSSKLIDKHIVEPTTSGDSFQTNLVTTTRMPMPVRNQQFALHGEVLDTEQSAQAADLRRLNASEQEPLYSSPSSNQFQHQQHRQQQQQQPTTTELPAVLLRPESALDFFASDPPATTTMAYATRSPTSPSSLISANSLIQTSIRPLGNQQQGGQLGNTGSSNNGETELVLKTNLIEPIRSTLVPGTATSAPVQLYSQQQQQQSNYNLDTGPFTPLEFGNNLYNQQYRQQQQQQVSAASSNLLAFRLRPPALVESMLNQYRSPFRPKPPVQVASYLARQLVAPAGGGYQQQTGAAYSGSKTSQQQTQEEAGSAGNNQDTKAVNNQTSVSSSSSETSSKSQPDLIILKPAMLANPSAQTYALRPEYLTTSSASSHQDQQGQTSRALQFPLDNRKLFDGPGQEAASTGELFYGLGGSGSLAGHQFDHLSSLSSPPSTSMVLDPLQVSNSMQTYNFQLNEQLLKQQQQQRQSDGGINNSLGLQDEDIRPIHKSHDSSSSSSSSSQQQQHQPNQPGNRLKQQSSHDLDGDGQLMAANQTGASSSPPPPKPSQELPQIEFNILQRDNNTDNAILSHVMSLISSNAIPTPPLVPLASAYSSADYFLPVSDHASHHHHHHYRRQTLRMGRSLSRTR